MDLSAQINKFIGFKSFVSFIDPYRTVCILYSAGYKASLSSALAAVVATPVEQSQVRVFVNSSLYACDLKILPK